MEMINVDSSNVARVGYDEESNTLQVEFLNGGTYQYFDIPRHIFDGLRCAGSVGKYLNDQVKGSYRYSKV